MKNKTRPNAVQRLNPLQNPAKTNSADLINNFANKKLKEKKNWY